MVKIAGEVDFKVPSGPWVGMQKPRGLRGKRFRPLLRDPEVLDPGALAPGLRVCLLSSGVEWAWLGLPVIF